MCANLEGEHGIEGLLLGVPCILGKDGVEKVIELDLAEQEKAANAKSTAGVRKAGEEAEGILQVL